MRSMQLAMIRQRVERLHVETQSLSPDRLVAILLEGRQRARRGDFVRRTPEESRAAGRRLRALLRGEPLEPEA